MEKHELLKAEFTAYLKDYESEINESASALKKDGCDDEAKLERIKGNIVDIFSKMFVVSYNNVFKCLNNPHIKEAIEGIEDDYEKLGIAFNRFLDIIPAGWVESKGLADGHDDTVKSVIEQVKLETADSIRKKFNDLYLSCK